jgi:hypothetical protein
LSNINPFALQEVAHSSYIFSSESRLKAPSGYSTPDKYIQVSQELVPDELRSSNINFVDGDEYIELNLGKDF